MNSSDVRCAFLKLKPLCDTFVKYPQRSVLAAILTECQYLPDAVLQEIQTYVLYPFVVHLKRTSPSPENNEDLRLGVVRGMRRVFSRTHVASVEHFLKYYSVLIYQIFDKNSHEKVAPDLDEDLALSVVQAVTDMTLRLARDTLDRLYVRRNAPQLGQGIYLCVQIAKTQRYKALRIAALQCILALSAVHEDQMEGLHGGELNAELCGRVADVLMFFLPGLMGALQEIAVGDEKQGRFLTRLAIRGIGIILCTVMMDRSPGEDRLFADDDFKRMTAARGPSSGNMSRAADPFGKKLRSRGGEGMLEHLETAERNEEWLRAAGDKLAILVAGLEPLRSHSQPCVRTETALMCFAIVRYCPRNMRPSLKRVLDTLIILSEDDNTKTVEACQKALDRFGRHATASDAQLFADTVEDGFSELLKDPPSFLCHFDVRKQTSKLNLLKGYLRLLCSKESVPQRLTRILSSSAMLNRFALLLLNVFKMECSRIKLTEDLAIRDMDSSPTVAVTCPWRAFIFLEDPESLRSAVQICDILGGSEAVHLLVDYLLDDFKRRNDNKKEIVFLLNQMTAALSCSVAAQETSSSAEHLIKNIASNYLEPENWYPPIKVRRGESAAGRDETLDVTVYDPRSWTKERTLGLYEGAFDVRYTEIGYRHVGGDEARPNRREDSCATISEAQNNIVKICLMTEGIGQMALGLRNDPILIQQYLQKSLYLILERAGSSNEAIHLSGMRALTLLTEASRLHDITQLIKQNADYFTHEANMKLKRVSDNAEVLDVLLVVMKYSDAPLLPCLYDIVSNVLSQCSQRDGDRNVSLFLRLFYTFIKFVKSKYYGEEEQSSGPRAEAESSAALIPLLIDFHCCKYPTFPSRPPKKMFTKDSSLRQEYLDCKTDDQSEDAKQSPDPHIAMIVSVLRNTLNFIPSKDRDQKLSALEVFREGVTAIRRHEDSLLPLVHAVWAPLVARMRETTRPLLAIAAFRLLTTLADVSKDFIRARTQSDVLPLMCDFLSKASEDSETKRDGSGYAFSQRYKLQLSYLRGLGDLCVALAMREKEIHRIMVATQAYLSCKQPKPLQAACVELYASLMKYNMAVCWLHINTLWNADTTPVTKPYFFKFSCSNINTHCKFDYQNNVTILMNYNK